MDTPELWTLSISAFAAVMLLLGLLAVAIRLLTLVFPSPPAVPVAAAAGAPAGAPAGAIDAPVLAAIHAAVQRVLPGARVSHVEEAR